jgi:oligopeptide transport system substrate-binding protein
VGQFLEDQLEKNLGVEVTLEFYDQAQYFESLFTGNFDVTLQSWFADWPSPDNFLGLFHSQSGSNFIGYNNPNYDQLLTQAGAAAEQETRLELYYQAQELLLEEAALAPLYNEIDNTFVKPSVLDMVITGIDGALKGDGFFWKTKIIVPDKGN